MLAIHGVFYQIRDRSVIMLAIHGVSVRYEIEVL